MNPVYSLVVPIYNEEAALPVLLHRLDALLDKLDAPAEAIFVDDGSRDASAIVCEAKARADRRYRYIRLSRNFGHQIAITTGMDRARGEAVIVMDADREGYDVVYAERLSRAGESRFKRLSADLFYRAIARLSAVEIPRNVGDFRLVDRKALDCFRAMPERDRFVRGMFAWLGFRQTAVQFHRAPRVAGETKYPLFKMIRLAASGVISFSDAPLRLALWAGMAVSALAMLYGCWVIAMWASQADVVRGWSSTIVITAFLCGANMLMTGIMGLYVGRIYAEVKGRPLYVIDRTVGFETQQPGERSEPASARRLSA
jgi:dolichol-phosphate mannosyltransferase